MILEFIDYHDMYNILNQKINATHDEVQFWARQFGDHDFRNSLNFFEKGDLHDILLPFISDIPDRNIHFMPTGKIFDPTISFYLKKNVETFDPPKHSRLVYIKDLSASRSWTKYIRTETNTYSDYPALDRAAQNGLIRFYDPNTYEFSYYQRSKTGDRSLDKLWILTSEGEHYVTQPDNFFLLQDIVNIERIFFNRPRDECLAELGFNPKDFEYDKEETTESPTQVR